MLRFNLKGELTSSDLSDYIKFTCHGVGKDKSCTIDDSDTSIDSYIKDYNKLLESSSDDSIQSYGTVSLHIVCTIILSKIELFLLSNVGFSLLRAFSCTSLSPLSEHLSSFSAPFYISYSFAAVISSV